MCPSTAATNALGHTAPTLLCYSTHAHFGQEAAHSRSCATHAHNCRPTTHCDAQKSLKMKLRPCLSFMSQGRPWTWNESRAMNDEVVDARWATQLQRYVAPHLALSANMQLLHNREFASDFVIAEAPGPPGHVLGIIDSCFDVGLAEREARAHRMVFLCHAFPC